MRPGYEPDHSSLSSAEVKQGWVCIFTSPLRLEFENVLMKHRDNSKFTSPSLVIQLVCLPQTHNPGNETGHSQ